MVEKVTLANLKRLKNETGKSCINITLKGASFAQGAKMVLVLSSKNKSKTYFAQLRSTITHGVESAKTVRVHSLMTSFRSNRLK